MVIVAASEGHHEIVSTRIHAGANLNDKRSVALSRTYYIIIIIIIIIASFLFFI
jgi:hypothetical protein